MAFRFLGFTFSRTFRMITKHISVQQMTQLEQDQEASDLLRSLPMRGTRGDIPIDRQWGVFPWRKYTARALAWGMSESDECCKQAKKAFTVNGDVPGQRHSYQKKVVGIIMDGFLEDAERKVICFVLSHFETHPSH